MFKMNKKINIIDTTMRDGSHAMSHSFSKEQVRKIAKGLDDAGINIIEISHGDGLAGSSINYGFSKTRDIELIKEASQVIKNAKLGALLLPGIGTIKDLQEAYDNGVRAVRVATHVTEADIAIQHIKAAKERNMFTVGFLMMVHMASPEKILEQAKIFEECGVDYVNLADSAGHLTPDEVKARISLLNEKLNVPVGFHAHNNMGLAIANSIAAAEEGAKYIDGTCRGLGAGAGNCQEEVFVAVLDRLGYTSGVDLDKILEVAENIVDPIMLRPQKIDTASLMLGYVGVYSSFLLHANRAAERFGLKAKDILVELGRRKMIGGQEDMIVDVAYMLSQQMKKESEADK
jgi:4-hydroxy 2-oxovalerate aldolase